MIGVTVTGNLGRDAELKYHDGTAVTSFTVASRRHQNGEEHTDWVSVSFWGKRAESVSKYLTKGKPVAVRGNLWVREYTHNNERRFSIECRADDVELLGGNGGDKSPSGGGKNEVPF